VPDVDKVLVATEKAKTVIATENTENTEHTEKKLRAFNIMKKTRIGTVDFRHGLIRQTYGGLTLIYTVYNSFLCVLCGYIKIDSVAKVE
jgi:hypothetical protein